METHTTYTRGKLIEMQINEEAEIRFLMAVPRSIFQYAPKYVMATSFLYGDHIVFLFSESHKNYVDNVYKHNESQVHHKYSNLIAATYANGAIQTTNLYSIKSTEFLEDCAPVVVCGSKNAFVRFGAGGGLYADDDSYYTRVLISKE